MKKKILIICLLLISIFTFTGCNKYRASFDEMNAKFIDEFSTEESIKTFEIQSLKATRYEEKYYYLVKYNISGESEVRNYLYVFNKYSELEGFFVADEMLSDVYQLNEDYKEYYDALNNGKNITFTDKEIKKMIKDFYGD